MQHYRYHRYIAYWQVAAGLQSVVSGLVEPQNPVTSIGGTSE